MTGPDIRSLPLKSATSGEISLAFRDLGTGFPLILLNGFASTMDMWNPPLLSALSDLFRVIIFDHRGTGYSSSSDMPFSLPLFAEDAAALLGSLGISRAHVLGHSMGACMALELALARPELVEKLVLVSGNCGGKEAIPMQPGVWATLSDKSGSATDVADRMFSVLFTPEWLATHDPWQYCPEVYETTGEDVAARQAAAFSSWAGCYDRLPVIHAPTLLLTGTDDVIIPAENSFTLGRRIPGAKVVPVCGAGHGLMYQHPEEVAGTVISFLET
ncbi:MAG: alpha/beta hydrolase [Methanoregula sp.]|jgi:pimeloyl-ACP methyl ester carboxylesterase|uniref:alpha/beta fold hydrolase n=1 Tax=Methanoregula sp. TaxID=2052170 RepID=UPI003D14509F